MPRELRSQAELREICLRTLRRQAGFEDVGDILIRPCAPEGGGANWAFAGFRPRVDNAALRRARDVIDHLRNAYQLRAEAAQASECGKRIN
ncbi:MAG: hypothetical protein ACLQL2_01220 [Methylovirgula sp.]